MYEFIFISLQLLLFGIVYLLALGGHASGVLIAGIAAFPLYGTMAVYEARRERWVLSPLAVYLGVSIIYLGFVPLYMYAAMVGEYDIFYIGLINVESEVPMSVAMCVLTVLCFYCGYKLTEVGIIKQILQKVQARTVNYELRLGHWLAFIGVGWVLFILMGMGFKLRNIGTLTDNLVEITCGAPFFILISRYGKWKGEYRIFPAGMRIVLAGIAMAAYVFYAAMGSGMRFPIIAAMFYFIWGYMLQQEIALNSQSRPDRIKALAKPALLGLVSMLFVVTVIMPYGKQIFAVKVAQGEKIDVERSEHHFYELRETFPAEGIWAFPYRLLGNSINALAVTINLYDNNISPEHRVHESVATGVIPRLFWPEKPFVSQGAYFSMVVGYEGFDNEKDATTSTGSTAAGELYWCYGIMGLILGMGLLGLIWGFTYKVVSSNLPAHPIKALVSGLLVYSATAWFGADATALFVYIIFFWVVLAPPIFIRIPIPGGSRLARRFVPAGGGG